MKNNAYNRCNTRRKCYIFLKKDNIAANFQILCTKAPIEKCLKRLPNRSLKNEARQHSGVKIPAESSSLMRK